MIIQDICADITSIVNRGKVLHMGIVICSLCAMLIIVMPSNAELSSISATQMAAKNSCGFLMDREFLVKDKGVAIAGLQAPNSIAERQREIPRNTIEFPNLKKPDGNKNTKNSYKGGYLDYFHWFLLLWVGFLTLYGYYLRYKLILYDRAGTDFGIMFFGSPFRRGEKGITAFVWDRASVQKALGMKPWYVERHEKLMLLPGYAEAYEAYEARQRQREQEERARRREPIIKEVIMKMPKGTKRGWHH